MQYHLGINVQKASEWGLDGQLACLFSYLLTVPTWIKPVSMDNDHWYWIARSKVLSEVPFLGTNPDTVYRQMKKLQEKGLIKIHKNRGLRRTYIALTDKAREWVRQPDSTSENNPMGASENNPMSIGKKSEGSVNQVSVNQKDHKPLCPSDDKSSDERSSGNQDCPHKEILEIWKEVMPEKPHPNPSLWPNTKRAKDLAARWKDGFSIQRTSGPQKGDYLYTNREEGIRWWRRFFMVCRKSDFLMGKGRPREDSGKTFDPDLAWFVKRDNFVKILELKYHSDTQETTSRPAFKNGIEQ